MYDLIKKIIFLIGLTVSIWGQFKSDVPQVSMPSGLTGQSGQYSGSWLDPSRFNMQHGFSVSMLRVGQQTLSVGSYTNQMTFMLRNNLRLQTNFTLMQPAMRSLGPQSSAINGQVYYGASLEYRPLKNTLLQFSFNNYPYYTRQAYSPFQLGIR
ncbi:MAG: hypothetical protein GXO92_07570 [FCB group bacterium]|nr:hypothetical protein [FCB group bacterium]